MSAKKRGKPVKPAKTTKVATKTAKKPVVKKAAKKAGKGAPRGAAKKAAKKLVAKKAAPKKGAPKKTGKAVKSAPKKSPPMKSPPKKVATKAPKAKRAAAPKSEPVSRRDATGHLDPKYAAELHELSVESEEPSTERAFIQGTSSTDALAEELGEEFVASITSGEDDAQEKLSEDVDEDQGGPFVVTTGGTEFAEGTDESNPDSATKEPFPKT